ncbi:MAG: valine--tRNA ligase [Flavobacteriaceae bacterium]|nr:valine--tRNA ligase [Flavobacteriaceae bacterium]
MRISSKYDANLVEDKWYDYWMKHNYFHSEVDQRVPYTIVIPPPNVTGVLHMGHMLNNTIQDVLIRRARLMGKNACWVPGIDHASIATEAKVVAKLKEEGIDKNVLSREEFLEHAWEWKRKYGGIILEQLKKLGASCDWERTKFTMDPEMSEAVIQVFVALYNKGLIYRGYRMVNWDPEAKTTLSDEEVEYVEKQGKLYYVSYQIEDSNETLTIATTRPETILGDTAICIHPTDERHEHLKGKRVVVPICNRSIPVIEDEYVDVEFGTGCLKVTPAHDENDKILGDKHNLEVIDIFNNDATLNSYGMHYEGKDRFVVRKEIVRELEGKGHIVKIEHHTNRVGISERTKAIIEPRLSDQWFLKMEELAKPALDAVLTTGDVKLFPKKFENTYRHWMENIRDWNISRQLWWGQQIPAYYYGDGKDDFVVAENQEKALELAREASLNPGLQMQDLKQDADVLDTWFSSWLWPISVFDGIRNPENKEINYYYPTNDLVTGPDILFFWVARMIIAGYAFKDTRPFNNVYLTGLVRDKQRRKMSKQLGNSPDALKLIRDYGADGVRVGLLLSAAAGNDLMFDEALCQQGKGLANKVWSAFYLTTLWETSESVEQPKSAAIAIKWYESKFYKTLEDIEHHFSKYRLSDALMAIYKLIFDDFCGFFLELVKPPYQHPINLHTYHKVIELFEDNLKILHPFMPFLTEEIWQSIKERRPEEALIIASYPQQGSYDLNLMSDFDFATEVISGLRTVRKERNIAFKDPIEVFIMSNEGITGDFNTVIQKLTNSSAITEVTEKVSGASFRVKSNEYFVPLSLDHVNVKVEVEKLTKELTRAEGFLAGIQKKLSNERFVNNAPEKVIALELKKESDTLAKIETIRSSLKRLR